jgi:hypothetical protein
MSARRWAAACVVLCGCFQEIPDDIPCAGDESCPTGYWCNAVGTCSDLGKVKPPELMLVGASNSQNGPFGNSVVIPRGGGQVALQITNRGGSEAAYPDIALTAPACFDVDGTISSNLVGIIDTGQTVVAHQTVARPTAPCPDATVNVEMKLSGGVSGRKFDRIWTGSFTAVLGP